MSYKTHICLVSAQAAPNLLPLLDPQLKPDAVVLLVTSEMAKKAEFLATAIQPLGIKVCQYAIDANAEFTDLQSTLMDIIVDYPSTDVALNATGGTKWMSIAAQEIFRENKSDVFYIDLASSKALFINGKPSVTLHINIKLESYLRAYGYHLADKTATKPQGLQARYKQLCEEMVMHASEWGEAIGYLNLLANKAEKSMCSRMDGHAPHLFDHLLQSIEAAQLAEQQGDNLVFANEQARQFLNGGWLEAYVNSQLNSLKSEGILQDSPRLNVEVLNHQGTKNELDVAFMANNRLHIIECKTKRLSGKQAGHAGTESLYKLDSISELGGLGTKAMLVSYRALNQYDAQRAKELRIQVIQPATLMQLKSSLRNWIQQN